MNKIADFACQRRKHLKSGELDQALLRMYPKMNLDVCRFLRRPLARWYVAAIRFLRSPQQRADECRFSAAIFDIAVSCPNHCSNRVFIDAMFQGLNRERSAALPHFPADCPSRYSCALLHVIESLFDKGGGRNDVCGDPIPRTDKGGSGPSPAHTEEQLVHVLNFEAKAPHDER
jgi:hypothetical protein